MEWWKVDHGDVTTDLGLDEPGSYMRNPFNNSGITTGASEGTDVVNEVARIRELWINGPRDTCVRYVVSSGNEILVDESYDDAAMYCPLGWARFMDTGTFYGAGLFDLLFGICRQAEHMMKSLFNNIRDTDRYGRTVAVCSSRGVDLNGWLVTQGWAVAYRHYSRDYVRAEDQARAASRGVWSGQFDMPWEWRADRR
jgi:hypothetical protein